MDPPAFQVLSDSYVTTSLRMVVTHSVFISTWFDRPGGHAFRESTATGVVTHIPNFDISLPLVLCHMDRQLVD